MVEFGLILPVFFTLTLSVLDIGRAFYHYNSAANAVREAARFAAVWGGSQHPEFDWVTPYNGNAPGSYSTATSHPITQYAGTRTIVGKVIAVAPGFDFRDLTVNITAPNGAGAGNRIGVSLSYTFRPATALLLGGQPFVVAASSEMVIE